MITISERKPMSTTMLSGNITLKTSSHGIGNIIDWEIKIPYATPDAWRVRVTSRLSRDRRFNTSERQMLDAANQVLVLTGYVDGESILLLLIYAVNNP